MAVTSTWGAVQLGRQIGWMVIAAVPGVATVKAD